MIYLSSSRIGERVNTPPSHYSNSSKSSVEIVLALAFPCPAGASSVDFGALPDRRGRVLWPPPSVEGAEESTLSVSVWSERFSVVWTGSRRDRVERVFRLRSVLENSEE